MKKIKTLGVLIITILFLAACSSDDEKSNKEVVVNAFESLTEEAKSMDATFSLDLNVDAADAPATVQPYLDMVNDATFDVNMKYDEEAQKQEATVNLKGSMSPISVDLSVPVLYDHASQKGYIQTDSLYENFGMMFGLPAELDGKLIEFDLNQLGVGEVVPADEELQGKLNELVKDFLNSKDEDDFKSEGDNVYSVSFTQDELKDFIIDAAASLDETIDDAAKEQLSAEIDTMFETVSVDTFEIKTTVKDDQVKEQNIVADFVIDDPSTGKISINVTMGTVYNSINESVEFTIDPENADIMPFEELNSMMYMY